MRFLPAILLAISILLAPLVWHFSVSLFASGGAEAGSAVDSGARIQLEEFRRQIDLLQERVKSLEQRAALEATNPMGDDPDFDTENTIIGSYAQVVQIGGRRSINKGVTIASPRFLEGFLGRPRGTLSDDCQPMTNLALKEMLRLEQVGPIRVRMLGPAIASLRRVFSDVLFTDPDLYDRINSSGSLCVRRIRGSTDSLSTHAFGLSLDLNIDGELDTLGDGRTQLGLTILADFFQKEGWVWGAGFGREDSMHFEVGRELLESWRAQGEI